MSTFPLESTTARLRVVDLDSVRSSELDDFFQREVREWREELNWDVSTAVAAFRRALDRGGVQGKAVRAGSRTIGYAYFLIEGSRGVITGLSVAPESPEWKSEEVGSVLVRAAVAELERRRVSRIESQFLSFDSRWLVPVFEAEGFRTYWREFRRMKLAPATPAPARSPGEHLSWHAWKSWNLSEAALLMQSAHVGGIDGRMNELYRTSEGCRTLLTNVLRHRGCGSALPDVSVLARHHRSDRAAGFAVVTETAPRHAHLAQLAVAPEAQGRGLGRRLLSRVVGRLVEADFESLSLMVSRGNAPAVHLYRSFGFHPVVRFPVFGRDGRP